MERKRRSILKAITWRITGTVDTFLVSWLITGELKLALSIGLVEIITKMTLYYFHERLWTRIEFGKHKSQKNYVDHGENI